MRLGIRSFPIAAARCQRILVSRCCQQFAFSSSACQNLTCDDEVTAANRNSINERVNGHVKPSIVAINPALIDTFDRKHFYLRISLTERCNLRCTYCMPASGVDLSEAHGLLSVEEHKRSISLFTQLGVTKIRFTGGEPTLNKQLPELIRHASQCLRLEGSTTRGTIGMTTNGLVLQHQLQSLVDAGLTSVNISLDTLQPDKFASITRRDKKGLYKVLASIYAGLSMPALAVKVNVVLMRGFNDGELADFVEMTRHERLDVRFIELMPFDGNKWTAASFMGYREAIERLQLGSAHIANGDHNHQTASSSSSSRSSCGRSSGSNMSQRGNKALSTSGNVSSDQFGSTGDGIGEGVGGVKLVRDDVETCDPHDTTKWYRAEGHKGRVGFITSMSNHFCGGCNRLRITADGKLKVCLFGEEGLSLRDAFRDGATDEQVVSLIGHSVKGKKAVLGGHGTSSPEELATKQNRPMILIGG